MAIESNVFCLHGADPEVQAYAMAKYSRSAQSMVETIQELSQEQAESFLTTFYFAYGHRSIADLVHVPMVMESISMLAAIDVVDETRWDGQERSTRYQDFSKRHYYTPEGMAESESRIYHARINLLFEAYEQLTAKVSEQLRKEHPQPPDMTSAAWNRTIMARTFDITRYLLPLATQTSVGQITSARSLEGQISRLLSSPYLEMNRLAEKMREAAIEPAYNVNDSNNQVAVAPTLIKYAERSTYITETRETLQSHAQKIMRNAAVRESPAVTLIDFDSLEEEIACSLLYEASAYPMRQIRSRIRSLGSRTIDTILALGIAYRGTHDELLRSFRSGAELVFDIHMDIGGFRDMHRHRRCIQLFQEYSSAEYAVPDFPAGGDSLKLYRQVMRDIQKTVHQLQGGRETSEPFENYLLPLGMKKRFIMKMDFAELAYIAELRTGAAGHISYRRVAHAMYTAVAKKHPRLVKGLKVLDVDKPVDFFKR